MSDRDPQDAEILQEVGGGAIDPEVLIRKLMDQNYPLDGVIEALQRAIERGKIALDSDGMVIDLGHALAHAA